MRNIHSNYVLNSQTSGQKPPKGEAEHGLYRQVVFIWRFVYLINKGLLKCGLYLQGGLYSEVVFNTGLTIFATLPYQIHF